VASASAAGNDSSGFRFGGLGEAVAARQHVEFKGRDAVDQAIERCRQPGVGPGPAGHQQQGVERQVERQAGIPHVTLRRRGPAGFERRVGGGDGLGDGIDLDGRGRDDGHGCLRHGRRGNRSGRTRGTGRRTHRHEEKSEASHP
jgi:hypothetical protein